MPSMRDREMVDLNTLERVMYYAWLDFNNFISSINKYIEMFNLNPENINRKTNYNLFKLSDNVITPDKLSLNLNTNLNIKKLFQILIEREYISPKTSFDSFQNLFNPSDSSYPIVWIKKTSKKLKSKLSLADLLKLLGITTHRLNDTKLIGKYFLDNERKPMSLNLSNNKANDKSEYYTELKDIIEKVAIK